MREFLSLPPRLETDKKKEREIEEKREEEKEKGDTEGKGGK